MKFSEQYATQKWLSEASQREGPLGVSQNPTGAEVVPTFWFHLLSAPAAGPAIYFPCLSWG